MDLTLPNRNQGFIDHFYFKKGWIKEDGELCKNS